jgi:hypothetical protein
LLVIQKKSFFFRTHMGRARAWLRLALMQKKLADYVKVLIDHRDGMMLDFYELDALMMSEESVIIMGLLVGLNVIDCNLCLKVCLAVALLHYNYKYIILSPG